MKTKRMMSTRYSAIGARNATDNQRATRDSPPLGYCSGWLLDMRYDFLETR